MRPTSRPMTSRLALVLTALILPLTGCFDAVQDATEQPGVPGGLALACLRDDTFTGLVIEIDHAPDMAPQPSTVDLLESRLTDVCDKPGGVSVVLTQTVFEASGGWTADDVREEGKRTSAGPSQDGETLRWHILFPRGGSSTTGVLGQAVDASTAAIWPESIQDAENLFQRPSWEQMEGAVTMHEVGHLLGLVNLVYTSPTAHEDGEHAGHSDNQDSVMYHAVESSDLVNIFSGSVPDDYDSDDRADLAGLADGSISAEHQLWQP